MSRKSHLRLVVDTLEQQPSAIMSIAQQASGLLINIKAAASYRKLANDATGIPSGSPILEQRYSVHRSVNSEYDHINMTLVVGLENNSVKKVPTVHLTKATRNIGAISPIFVRVYPDLRLPRYHVLRHSKNLTVAAMDPDKQALATALFVGNGSDKELALECEARKHRVFYEKNFILVLMLHVFPAPSTDFGALSHVMTKTIAREPLPSDLFQRAVEGMEIAQAERLFSDLSHSLLLNSHP